MCPRARGSASASRPGSPGGTAVQASAARRGPSRRKETRRGRGDRRAAVPGPGVRHRHRQGRHGRDDPGAVREEPGAAGQRDPHVPHREARGAGAGGLAAVLAGARRRHGGDRRYWKPVFFRLEAEELEYVLADARQVKNLPGRPKRDTTDSQWLACCFERGSVFPCFVATPQFRIIRLHTRRRRDLTDERSRETAHGKAARRRGDQAVVRAHRPARGDRPGDHGPPHRRLAQPQGTGRVRPHPGPPQDPPAPRGAGGRGVLHRPSRQAAAVHP